jgi:hypothetical protein
MAKLPPQPLGVAPGSSYWNDWYEKLRTFVDQITTSVDWATITGTPTTAAGYGMSVTGTGSVVQQTGATIINPLVRGGTGAPAGALGANGDFYFRGDTPGVANQRIYVKSAGVWVGIL